MGILKPTATIEFELANAAAVEAAVQEMKRNGQEFIHEARTEPWGQTVARFMSPEGVLVGLSYAPWLHE
ncbi:VOC family protein [Halomonas sp.]|uniref:VOC family protein n=1 Tax=Halomonas sp. TaxID=1486246 RepID=UPI003459A477